jgi:hypothetical protein
MSDSKELAPVTKRLPPAAGRGRKHGELNKTTRTLKEAILLAAELSGRDTKGTDGLVGYLQRVADEDVKAFSGLLGKVLPLTVSSEGGPAIQITISEKLTEL